MQRVAMATIRKVDEAKRQVWGTLVEEVPDRAGEIFDYATSKPYFERWNEKVAKQTARTGQEVSLGALRAMHKSIGAGKFISVEFDDAAKRITVGAEVVDDQEWRKVLKGVYTGFSIGGDYVNRWPDPTLDGYKRYTADPIEGSLVDVPCVPTAEFEVVKVNGAAEMRKFVPTAKKSLCDVAYLLDLLECLAAVQRNLKDEALIEGDGSQIPSRLAALAEEMAGIVKDALDEELSESVIKAVEKKIEQRGSKWVVLNDAGTKVLGTFDTKAEAEKRLAQIEHFKATSKVWKKLADYKVGSDDNQNEAEGDKKAHKGMDQVSDLSECLKLLKSIHNNILIDSHAQSTGSDLAGQVQAEIGHMSDLLKSFVEFETGKLAAKTSGARLQKSNSEVKEMDNQQVEELVKKRAKKMAKKLAKRAERAEKKAAKKAADEQLIKDVEDLKGAVANLIKAIGDQPVQPRANARVVAIDKGADDRLSKGADPQPAPATTAAAGPSDPAVEEIKKVHAAGGTPVTLRGE